MPASCDTALTAGDFAALAASGRFDVSAYELVDGRLRRRPPVTLRAAAVAERLRRLLAAGGGAGDAVRAAPVLRLSRRTVLTPSLGVFAASSAHGAAPVFTASDARLVVEVSSFVPGPRRFERAAWYGDALVPRAWFVDDRFDAVADFRFPAHGGYRRRVDLSVNDHLAFPGAVDPGAGPDPGSPAFILSLRGVFARADVSR